MNFLILISLKDYESHILLLNVGHTQECNMVPCNYNSIHKTLIVFIFNFYLVSTTRDLNREDVFIGCYKTTVYAGMNATRCLCGEEISNTLSPVNETKCSPENLSVYKLLKVRASDTDLLIASEKLGIRLLVLGDFNKTLMSKGNNLRTPCLTYYLPRKELFYISNSTNKKSILRLNSHSYDQLGNVSYNGDELIKTDCNEINGLAIDWFRFYTIFWACRDKKAIFWKQRGSEAIHSIHSGEISSIAVDSYRDFLLYTNGTHLVKQYYTWNTTKIFSQVHNFKQLRLAALDVQQERIYVIGGEEETSLVRTDYDIKKFKVIYKGPELSDAFGLESANGTVVWGNRHNGRYILYKVQVSEGDFPVEILWNDTEKIDDFKMQSDEARGASTNFLCDIQNCSHLCSRISKEKVECNCPPNFVLASNQRTCLDEAKCLQSEPIAEHQHADQVKDSDINRVNSTIEIILKRQEEYENRVQIYVAFYLLALIFVLAFTIILGLTIQIRINRMLRKGQFCYMQLK